MEYTNGQIRDLISEYIHSERDRAILCRRLIDGITMERLAEEFELSPRQVQNIIKKNEKILFKMIKQEENKNA